MAATTSIDQKETTSLIGSDKVEGTAVYGPDRGKIGSLERVMIDKLSGKVAYAVLSFGGIGRERTTAAFTRTTKPTPTGNEATKNYWRVHLGAPDSPAMKEKTHSSKIFSGRK